MVLINKEESIAIREKYPEVCIARTCKQKSKRHRYYVEEAKRVLKFLRFLRNGGNPDEYNKKTRRNRV